MGAQSTASLDFGAFPGKSDTSLAITGQATILAGSLVEAWIFPADTADHTVDEHLIETIVVKAGNVVAGTGFTIYGFNTNQINEPIYPASGANSMQQANATTIVNKNAQPGNTAQGGGGMGTLLYGVWNVAWVWN